MPNSSSLPAPPAGARTPSPPRRSHAPSHARAQPAPGGRKIAWLGAVQVRDLLYLKMDDLL